MGLAIFKFQTLVNLFSNTPIIKARAFLKSAELEESEETFRKGKIKFLMRVILS